VAGHFTLVVDQVRQLVVIYAFVLAEAAIVLTAPFGARENLRDPAGSLPSYR
jgi:hypothetical protein